MGLICHRSQLVMLSVVSDHLYDGHFRATELLALLCDSRQLLFVSCDYVQASTCMTLHLWMKGRGPASDSTKEKRAAFPMVTSVKRRTSTAFSRDSLTVLCIDLCNCAADATTGAGQQHILRLEQLFCHDWNLNNASLVSRIRAHRLIFLSE